MKQLSKENQKEEGEKKEKKNPHSCLEFADFCWFAKAGAARDDGSYSLVACASTSALWLEPWCGSDESLTTGLELHMQKEKKERKKRKEQRQEICLRLLFVLYLYYLSLYVAFSVSYKSHHSELKQHEDFPPMESRLGAAWKPAHDVCMNTHCANKEGESSLS